MSGPASGFPHQNRFGQDNMQSNDSIMNPKILAGSGTIMEESKSFATGDNMKSDAGSIAPPTGLPHGNNINVVERLQAGKNTHTHFNTEAGPAGGSRQSSARGLSGDMSAVGQH